MSVSCYEINIIIYSDSDTEWVKKLMVQQKQQITPPPPTQTLLVYFCANFCECPMNIRLSCS